MSTRMPARPSISMREWSRSRSGWPGSCSESSRARLLCRKCAYPLANLADRRCSECGHPFDPDDPATYFELNQHVAILLDKMRLCRTWTIVCSTAALVFFAAFGALTEAGPSPTHDLLASWLVSHAVVSSEALILFAVLTLAYLFRIGRYLGAGFAVGHLVIAIVLTPFFLLGSFVAPLLALQRHMAYQLRGAHDGSRLSLTRSLRSRRRVFFVWDFRACWLRRW